MSDMPNEGFKLLPFYLVVDVSFSMDGEKINAANLILPQLVDTLAKNPILSDKVRFGVLDFSDDAQVLLPLCDLLDQETLPGFAVRGGTSYAAAFDALRAQIERDVNQLKADGFKVHRPAVFFMSDGEPTDDEMDWRAAFGRLTSFDKETGQGFSYYPNVIPFGIVGAEPEILQRLIHPSSGQRPMKMYLTDQGQDAAAAIGAMAEILVASVLMSGNQLATGGGGVVLPDDTTTPPGVTPVGPDDDLFL